MGLRASGSAATPVAGWKPPIAPAADGGTVVASRPAMSRLSVRRGASLAGDPAEALKEVQAAIDQPGSKAVLLFCSASYDLASLGRLIRDAFPCPVIGCTSAGQIGAGGYQQGGITAVSLASDELCATPYLVSPVARSQESAAQVAAQVQARLDHSPTGWRGFGLLLADALAAAEEGLVASLYQSLGNVPIVGGSAGDDLRFERTSVYWDGQFVTGAAVFTVFETSLPFSTFKLQHFRPTEKQLVTTSADPSVRLVREINGIPAADAYAELLGLTVGQLDSSVFSRHPVMLRLGSDHYVRSIQKVNPDRSLTFYCAIDEGLVLSVGEGVDPLGTLEQGLRDATADLGELSLVIGCDCVLRRLELEKRDVARRAGEILSSYKVIGFSTYGEQFNAVHVNQTFTGIALGG